MESRRSEARSGWPIRKREHGHQLVEGERLHRRVELHAGDGLAFVFIGRRVQQDRAEGGEHGRTDPQAQPGRHKGPS